MNWLGGFGRWSIEGAALRYGPCGLSFVLGFKKIDENRESNRFTERRQCVEVTRALMI